MVDGPRTCRRLIAITLGIAAGLALLEVGLRAAGAAYLAAGNRLAADPNDRRPLVAFVGDSNIYGLYVEPAQTLARRLEAECQPSGIGVRTINLGVPASPSWVALDQARRALALAPAVLVARVGINNYTSVPPDDGWGWPEKLLVVKSIRRALLAWRMRDAREADLQSGPGGAPVDGAVLTHEDQHAIFRFEGRDGGRVPFEVQRLRRALPLEQVRPRLEADLLAMARLAREAGSRLVIATYLAGSDAGFEELTKLARSLADREGIVVADCARILDGAIAAASAPGGWGGAPPSPVAPAAARALLLTEDQHPTALGYRAEARLVARELQKLGIAPHATIGDPLAVLPALARALPLLRRAQGASLGFRYAGDPKDRATLLLGTPGASWVGGHELPLARDPGDWCSGVVPGEISAIADGKGQTHFSVDDATAARLRGRVRAVAVTRRGGLGGASQRFLSEPLDFEMPHVAGAKR
jgi:hypothetical protein